MDNNERCMARMLYGKGYRYILLTEGMLPLYTKNMKLACDLLKTDLKNDRVDIQTIERFLA